MNFLFYRGAPVLWPWVFPFYRGPTPGGDGCPRFSTIKWGHPTPPLNLVGDFMYIWVFTYIYNIYIYIYILYIFYIYFIYIYISLSLSVHNHIYKYLLIMYKSRCRIHSIDMPLQCLLSATKLKVHMGNRSPVNSMNHARHNAKYTCSGSGAWRRK